MLQNILISKLFDLDLLDVALGNYVLNVTQQKELTTKTEMLDSGIPLDYIVGKVKILGLELIVNEHTLIPREETEHWLKRYKLQVAQNHEKWISNSLPEGWQPQDEGVFKSDVLTTNSKKTKPSSTLIDLGTGTGLIGLYLSEIYQKTYLLDIDKQALEVAKQNIELNQKYNCQTLISDGLKSLGTFIKEDTNWDLVANLPYLPREDFAKAKEYKVEYEPAIALYSGVDGLELYNKVLEQIRVIDNKPEKVIFELDPRNIRLAQSSLNQINYNTEIWLDQNGLERVLVGIKQ